MLTQFRLLTALLLVVITALVTSTLAQQRQHQAALEKTRKNATLSSKIHADSMLANRVLMYAPERFDAWSRTKVVTLLRDLWENEQRFDAADKAAYITSNAQEVAAEVLQCAKITTHQELIDYATTQTFYNPANVDDVSYLDAEGIEAELPELHDPSSQEYADFRRFIERAIK